MVHGTVQFTNISSTWLLFLTSHHLSQLSNNANKAFIQNSFCLEAASAVYSLLVCHFVVFLTFCVWDVGYAVLFDEGGRHMVRLYYINKLVNK